MKAVKVHPRSRFRVILLAHLFLKVNQNQAFTPAYGSLYGDNLATSNTNVDFHTVRPSSGVTLNIADNSITVNSTGIYTISFSTVILIFGFQDDPFSIVFYLSVNRTPDPSKVIRLSNTVSALGYGYDTLSRTDQLMLNQGDAIRVFITQAYPTNISYLNAVLVVTKVA